MTPNDLKRPQRIELVEQVSNADSSVNHTTNKKSKLKVRSMSEIGEINDEYLDGIRHDNNL